MVDIQGGLLSSLNSDATGSHTSLLGAQVTEINGQWELALFFSQTFLENGQILKTDLN